MTTSKMNAIDVLGLVSSIIIALMFIPEISPFIKTATRRL